MTTMTMKWERLQNGDRKSMETVIGTPILWKWKCTQFGLQNSNEMEWNRCGVASHWESRWTAIEWKERLNVLYFDGNDGEWNGDNLCFNDCRNRDSLYKSHSILIIMITTKCRTSTNSKYIDFIQNIQNINDHQTTTDSVRDFQNNAVLTVKTRNGQILQIRGEIQGKSFNSIIMGIHHLPRPHII